MDYGTTAKSEIRVDKAAQALQAGNRRLAAFYAGALAHYVGDLSQFCHIMGKESHWGSENKDLHANYEVAVERTINFKDRSSSLLDNFIEDADVDGDTPEEIARAVALFTERGENSRNPGWMHARYAMLKKQGIHLKSDAWDDNFTDQTGHNVNAAVNGIAKLLELLSQN